MEHWRPVPERLVRQLQRQTFSKAEPASSVEAWLLAWQAEQDGAPLSRREAAQWWGWGTTAARNILAEVRAMRASDRWTRSTPLTPQHAKPATPQRQTVEPTISKAGAPATPHKHPTHAPPSRARSSLDRDRDRDRISTEEVQQVYDCWRQWHPRANAKPTEPRCKRIRKAIAESGVEGCLLVMDYIHREGSWWKANDNTSLETLITWDPRRKVTWTNLHEEARDWNAEGRLAPRNGQTRKRPEGCGLAPGDWRDTEAGQVVEYIQENPRLTEVELLSYAGSPAAISAAMGLAARIGVELPSWVSKSYPQESSP